MPLLNFVHDSYHNAFSKKIDGLYKKLKTDLRVLDFHVSQVLKCVLTALTGVKSVDLKKFKIYVFYLCTFRDYGLLL